MERTTVAPTRTIRIAGERPTRHRTALGAVREFLAQSPLNVLGVALIGIFLFLVVFGSALSPHDPVQPNVAAKLQPPSATYWFGTDELGRDVLDPRALVPALGEVAHRAPHDRLALGGRARRRS